MKLISNKLYEQYTKEVIGFHQYIPNITKEQLYEVFKFHCANLRVLNEAVEYYSGLQQENKQLKEKLEKERKVRKEALNLIKAKEFVIDLSMFGYELDDYDIFKLKNILDIDKGE